jgi:hypothetical protein
LNNPKNNPLLFVLRLCLPFSGFVDNVEFASQRVQQRIGSVKSIRASGVFLFFTMRRARDQPAPEEAAEKKLLGDVAKASKGALKVNGS